MKKRDGRLEERKMNSKQTREKQKLKQMGGAMKVMREFYFLLFLVRVCNCFY